MASLADPPAALDLGQLLAAVGDAVVVTDPDSRVLFWNPASTRMFGYTEQEAIGQALDMIIPERLRPRHNEGYAHTMRTGVTKYGTTLLRVPAVHKDGSAMSIAFTVALLNGADGHPVAIAAVIRDETIRFAEERALKKRIAELEAQVAAYSPSS